MGKFFDDTMKGLLEAMKIQNKLDIEILAMYMDDDIREQVHGELAPCTDVEFLKRYLELDPSFQETIDNLDMDLDNPDGNQ